MTSTLSSHPLILAALNIAARAAHFGMFVAIAVRYGATAHTDEVLFYYAPLAVIMAVASGAIESGVTPHIHRAITNNTITHYLRRMSLVGPLLSMLAGLIVAGIFVALELVDVKVALTLCLAPIFATYSAIMSAYLTIKRRFAVVLTSPLPAGLSAIAFVAWLPQDQIYLASSLVAYEGLRSIFLRAVARNLVSRHDHGASTFDAELWSGTYRAVTLQIVGSALTALNPVIDMAFARHFLESGAVSQIDYATRIWTAVPFLFAPWITRLHADFCQGARDGWIDAKRVHRSAVATLPWVVLITATVMIASPLLGGFLFTHGEITEMDAAVIADLLLYYAPAAAALVIGQIYARALSSVVFILPLTIIAIISVLLNTALNYLLITRMGINGIAIATSVTYAVASTCLVIAFHRRMRVTLPSTTF